MPDKAINLITDAELLGCVPDHFVDRLLGRWPESPDQGQRVGKTVS
jgi:hypothetical protein